MYDGIAQLDYALRRGESQERMDQMDQIDNMALPVTMSADEAHEAIGGKAVISKSTFYAAINKGQIPHLRLGKRILIPRAAFMAWLAGAHISTPASPQVG
jgi:excisionase family DNA binding protein